VRHDKHDRFQPTLEISLTQEVLTLKGTGVDVEPALLSGNVVLHLSEPTSIREITLTFRGKARLPASASDA
jgi:arrestin-related trafficking adapter 4/5/7